VATILFYAVYKYIVACRLVAVQWPWDKKKIQQAYFHRNNSKQLQKNGVICAVHAEML
jgi:hypothetical protein